MFGIYKFELERVTAINNELDLLRSDTLQKRRYAVSHNDTMLIIDCDKLIEEYDKILADFKFFWQDVIKENNVKLNENFYVNINVFKCSQAKLAQYKSFLNRFSNMVNNYKFKCKEQGRIHK